jgi:LacI family transcriptional regulator
MRITSKQIAELAGVSRGTVDRALNNRGGVRPEVCRRILDIAAEYGYQPMRAGKALVMRETLTIGVLLNSVGNLFFDDVIRGINEAVQDFSDFSIELRMQQIKGYRLDEQLAALDRLAGENLSGLVLTPINHPDVAARLEQFCERGVPVVAINSDITQFSPLVYVGCDYLRSGQTAAQMLGLLRGADARILIVTGSLKVLGHNQRVYGFSRVLKSDFPQTRIVDVVENNDDEELSYQVVADTLRHFPEINALYFAAGGVLGGARAVLERQGELPTILTCDLNDTIRSYIQQGIVAATICQQPYLQGFTGVKVLLNQLLFRQPPEQAKLYTQNEIKLKYNL